MAYLKEKELTILIVTYGDRRKFLKKSLKMLEKVSEYVQNIVLVQNGVVYDLRKFLDSINLTNIDYYQIVNNQNLGSAGGFKIGIEKALQVSGQSLLILDDDNFVPLATFDALKNLDYLDLQKKYGNKIAISMYRPEHDSDSKKFQRNYDLNHIFFENTVHKFSVLHKLPFTKFKTQRVIKNVAESYTVPYSGLIVAKNDLKNIEQINSQYFVYCDDTRLTARLSQSGVRILTFENIVAMDQENSWFQSNHIKKQEKENDIALMLKMGKKEDLWRPFYQVRNGVCNSRQVFQKNKLVYWVNLLIFIIVPFFVYMPKNKLGLRNYLFFVKAVRMGHLNLLGKLDNNFFV